jgi:putative ABC transport system permease protein
LVLAAVFGLLVGLIFALRPLRRATAISGGALFRLAGLPARVPFSWQANAVQGSALLALVALAAYSAPRPSVVFGFCAGTILTLVLLRGIAALLMRLLPLLPRPRDAALAFGLRRLHGPASSLPLMLLSAGAGLTVLVAVAEIRGNLTDEFTGAMPASAPSFYFIDIQPRDLPTFEAALRKTGATHDLQLMPSLRARILAVAGVPVEQFHAPSQTAWPLRSDVAFTYAATPPPDDKLAKGKWWAPDYLGPPLVSFDARIARSWGLRIGDSVTVDVLGRDFNLRIASLRDVDWQSLQLNFLMVGTPDPFSGAPHTFIATVRVDPGQQGAVLAAVTDALPGVTGIDVGDVLAALAGLLNQIGTAVSLVGLIALLAGGLVLVSAIAAEREARIAEAVVLKTLGASRRQIRRAWLMEFAVAGGVAGLVAAGLGTAAAAITIRQVFHIAWHFQSGVMLMALGGSILMMLVLGFVLTARALRQPAAARLRLETGG